MSDADSSLPNITRHALVLAVVVGGFVWLASGRIATRPYTYDEADYMFDASLGYVANWTDSGSLSIVNFVGTGLSRGRDPGQRLALSDLVRNSSDPGFYRHYHPPLYYYWLVPVSRLGLEERAVRSLSLLFPALTAVVLYFGILRIAPPAAAGPAAILLSAFFLWDRATVDTSEVAP